MEQLPEDVQQLLEKIVEKKLDEFSVNIHDPNRKGSGHLGEFFFVSLKDKSSEMKHDFAVKRNLACESNKFQKMIDHCFKHEIYFYNSLLPAYRQMEQKYSAEKFDKLSTFYGADDTHSMFVLNNLKLSGFKTHEKRIPLDKAHYELIFETYGRLHALSFAFRHFNPEEYAAAKDVFKNGIELSAFMTSAGFAEETSKWIGNSPELNNLIGDLLENLRESYFYNGHYELLVHGDCWSNNIMFSYDETNRVKDIRLIDFQICRTGTPVFDLSYCFYSGASKALLSQLNYFLDVYHDSLSRSLEQFGLSSDVIYPMSVLKEEWKKYCKFGFFSATIIWKIKMLPDEEAPDLTMPEDKVMEKFGGDQFITEEYLVKIQDLIDHLKENNFV
ncbi:unnamed protein product [Acanthoscelides obtectus]|uniref:CHK kinase-like domain-containing protein n=1 Tax=Acanthoscelides obtectus TaxID=200917 RepID=A0A9P0KGL8_ACAOB|nr:unnamed protein product [Acanthoscelides obtectus]CAK1670294.1 hypothetical protein AOBTE_LOCUS27536 [Acanthoscelides obtectus]